ncbi:MAG: hypothetical protein HYX80_08365 [Chloroflexi bacterium]|nr:hypothetical protein [Chloroflexota bacterium]
MNKKALWLLLNTLMALSLVAAACGPAAVEEKKPAPPVEEKKPVPVVEEKKQEVVEKEVVKSGSEAPKYGGTLNLVLTGDILNFDSSYATAGNAATIELTNQELWAGDWAKGPAGGYGAKDTDWGDDYDVFDLKTGHLAESVKWTADEAKNQGTIIYQVRQGVHWGLNSASEASRLVGGRELTPEDVISELKRSTTDPKSYNYRGVLAMRNAQITKTGPWEVTVRVPLEALISAISRLGDALYLHPPEVILKYGSAENWKNAVGTGPFMLTDYVGGSAAILTRTPITG